MILKTKNNDTLYLTLMILTPLLSVMGYMMDRKLLARVFFIIWTVCLTYFILKLFKHYLDFGLRYLFNKPVDRFEKKVEGPRIAFYALGVLLTFCVLYTYTNSMIEVQVFDYNISLLNYVVFNLIATFAFISMHFSWRADFNKKNYPDTNNFFVAEVSNQNPKLLQKEEAKDFNLKIEDVRFFEKLYENLYDMNFISEPPEVNSKNFVETLLKGKIPKKPLFELKMDNIQTRLFYDLLSEKSKGFPLTIFLKIFENKNGSPTPSSIYTCTSKNKSAPKREKDIKKCFVV